MKNTRPTTLITGCTCQHSQQDRMYGGGQRVFNHAPGGSGKSPDLYRCSVCGTSRPIFKEKN